MQPKIGPRTHSRFGLIFQGRQWREIWSERTESLLKIKSSPPRSRLHTHKSLAKRGSPQQAVIFIFCSTLSSTSTLTLTAIAIGFYESPRLRTGLSTGLVPRQRYDESVHAFLQSYSGEHAMSSKCRLVATKIYSLSTEQIPLVFRVNTIRAYNCSQRKLTDKAL